MTCLNIILVFAAALAPGFTFLLDDAAQKCVNWPEEYHLRGEQLNYVTGIIRPFETWYSAARNKSRVDYNGGTVKHYYILEEDHVKEFNLYPVTTEDITNEIMCEGKRQKKKKLISILPIDDDYTLIGQKKYNDMVVDVCKYSDVKEDLEDEIEKKFEKSLYVYQDSDGNSVPVFQEVKKINLWTGALDNHFVTRFYDYGLPDDDVLDHNQEESCNRTSTTINLVPLENVQNVFDSYSIHHGKEYEGDEHNIRKQILMENRRRVIEHNRKNLSYKMTLNKFSDWTDEELASLSGTRPSEERVGSMPFPHSEEEVALLVQDLPKHYDMRNEGYISSVKNQADCGSCWSFSTVAAVEGALARSNGGRNLDLSEQSLVDCAWGFLTFGCSGGMVDGTYKYILKHGIPSEMEYGLYLSKEGWCKLENMTELYRIRGFATVPSLSIDAMKVALYKYGPVTVTINANKNIAHYDSGIFYDPTCNEKRINHGVTVVGYGERDGVVYWIVKNSWGEDWGQDGYILFSATNNNCHILEDPYFPIV